MVVDRPGTIGTSTASTKSRGRKRRSGPDFIRARISRKIVKAAQTEGYSGRISAVRPETEAGQSRGQTRLPQRTLSAARAATGGFAHPAVGPEKGEDGGRQHEDRRLAHQRPGRVDERG